jgi:hypothetical protein
MTRPVCQLDALVALALTLGAGPLGAGDQRIRDDFVEDPNWADREPLTWQHGQHP